MAKLLGCFGWLIILAVLGFGLLGLVAGAPILVPILALARWLHPSPLGMIAILLALAVVYDVVATLIITIIEDLMWVFSGRDSDIRGYYLEPEVPFVSRWWHRILLRDVYDNENSTHYAVYFVLGLGIMGIVFAYVLGWIR